MKVEFWKDEDKNSVDPKLFSEVAEKTALEMRKEHEISKGRKANKRSQIRKFYDEIVRLNNSAQNKPKSWDIILPQVHMLAAKAAYAEGRELVSNGFSEFIRESVKRVTIAKDLKIFADFFEAFMGFYRLHGPNN